MRKFVSYFLLAVILPAFILSGCKDDKDPITVEKGNFEILKSHMVANELDLPTLLAGFVTAPVMVADGGIVAADYTIPGYFIFDIRSATDFAAGHIEGAMNVALTDVVSKANEVGEAKPIIVVCYTGQTATRATMALRLSGFEGATAMKFGMSYWNAQFDKWTAKIGDPAVGSPNWNVDASAALPVNGFPTWETTSTDGEIILADAVTAMLAKSDWSVSSADVLATPSDYIIYNFWTADEFTTFGHFTDAYQLKPISLADDVVAALPTSDDFLVYCFTGQTSSFTVAWLQVLGYNAKSISFGVNSLSHTALDDAGKPAWHHSYEYDYVTSK